MSKQKARHLRKNQTDAERLLWYHLRDRRLGDIKFRRQYWIGPYVADFACIAKRLVVEVDGTGHSRRVEHDAERTRFLQSKGFKVLRFWNNQVLMETEAVLEAILQASQDEPFDHPSPQPLSPPGERG